MKKQNKVKQIDKKVAEVHDRELSVASSDGNSCLKRLKHTSTGQERQLTVPESVYTRRSLTNASSRVA